jgi:sugar phosphate permease
MPASKEVQALTMKELWRIRMVPEVAIAVFCLKTVRYALYMWLPMYLFQEVLAKLREN